jgi:hypothetical protein
MLRVSKFAPLSRRAFGLQTAGKFGAILIQEYFAKNPKKPSKINKN